MTIEHQPIVECRVASDAVLGKVKRDKHRYGVVVETDSVRLEIEPSEIGTKLVRRMEEAKKKCCKNFDILVRIPVRNIKLSRDYVTK